MGRRNNSAATAALLAPVLGNADHLGPIGGTCTHNPGDHDWWRFTLSSLKTVIISLEWYERLSALALFIEADDPGNEGVDMLTRHSLPGVTVLTGILGPGTYRLRVTGSGATAYEIGVRLSRAILQPDGFEPNNGFDAAATLLFHASQRPVYVLLGRWWGPGTFDGTLNWRTVAIGPYIIPLMDADWFRLDGRVEIGSQQRFSATSIISTNRSISSSITGTGTGSTSGWGESRRSASELDKAEIHYLELRSQRQTRYRITTGMMVDPAILPPDIDLAKVFPEWWRKNPFVELGVDPSWHFIQIGEGEYDVNPAFEFALQFEDLSGDAEITLLDAAGQVIRQASAKGGGRAMPWSGPFRSSGSRRARISFAWQGVPAAPAASWPASTCSRHCASGKRGRSWSSPLSTRRTAPRTPRTINRTDDGVAKQARVERQAAHDDHRPLEHGAGIVGAGQDLDLVRPNAEAERQDLVGRADVRDRNDVASTVTEVVDDPGRGSGAGTERDAMPRKRNDQGLVGVGLGYRDAVAVGASLVDGTVALGEPPLAGRGVEKDRPAGSDRGPAMPR